MARPRGGRSKGKAHGDGPSSSGGDEAESRGVAEDIGERERSEREPADDSVRFREVFENAPTAMALVDLDGTVFDVNAALCSIRNIPREQLVGRTFSKFSHPDDLDAGLERLAQLREKKSGSYRVERRFVGPGGDTIWTTSSVSLVRDDAGEPLYFIVQIQDVSEQKRTEQALAEANQRFEGAFEDAPFGVAIGDLEGTYIDVNPAMCSMLGYTREQLLGKTTRDITHPDDTEETDEQLEQLVEKGGGRYTIEKRYMHADGHPVWVRTTVSLMRGTAGEPLYYIGHAEDISERKRSERALVEANQRFVGAFENTPIGMALVDTGGNYLEVNPALCRILGYTRERLLETDFQTVTHPDDRAVGAEYMRGQLAGEQPPYWFEKRYIHADSHEVWTRILSSLVRDERGEPLYFVTQVEDISERKRMEEEIRRATTVLEEAQQLASVGGWEWSVRENRLYFSPALRRIAGIADDETPGVETVWEHMRNEDMEWLVPQVERAIGRNEPFQAEFRYVLPDGRERTMNLRGLVEPDEEGSPLRVVGVVQDVTERVEVEAARRQLEAQMQEAQRLESLGVLAGGIAHDFNNLLVGILGNAGLAALELPPGSPTRLLIDQIEIAARRAAELTKQMLAYSGRGQFVVRLLDMREVVRDTATLLESAISKNVKMTFEFADDLPSVRADVAQMRQLIMNLITNASDAIGEAPGEIAVRIGARAIGAAELAGYTLSEGLTESTYVSIEVADDGSGMDAETLAKIFDPFFTTKFSGHGLGLAAVLGIVRGHHGAIKVWSELAKGSRFSLLLPAVEDEPAPVDEASLDLSWTGSGTVLVVDDEEIVRRAARRILGNGGLKIVEASNGQEALEIFRNEPGAYQVALVDLVMPGMTGAELVEALRVLRPDLPVVFSSGYDARALAESAGRGAKTSFLEKPYRAQDLLNSVRLAMTGD